MPINIPSNLPAKEILEKENVFIMEQKDALHQDIRAVKIGILNLMPLKVETEMQLLRMLSNTPLQVEVELIRTATHDSHHTPIEHLNEFYKTFEEIKDNRFDGFIITGAPVEQLEFQEVDYWNELKEIMEWADQNVTSTLYICWAAQAALYHHYGVKKYPMGKKVFGVFPHRAVNNKAPLLRGLNDTYYAPHSRRTEIKAKDIQKVKDLEILSLSKEAGVHIVASRDGKKIFITGHSEYNPDTLKNEYERDLKRGLPIEIPKHYFLNDDPNNPPFVNWRATGFLIYSNWLNYYVYQTTPYNWIYKKQRVT